MEIWGVAELLACALWALLQGTSSETANCYCNIGEDCLEGRCLLATGRSCSTRVAVDTRQAIVMNFCTPQYVVCRPFTSIESDVTYYYGCCTTDMCNRCTVPDSVPAVNRTRIELPVGCPPLPNVTDPAVASTTPSNSGGAGGDSGLEPDLDSYLVVSIIIIVVIIILILVLGGVAVGSLVYFIRTRR